MEKQHEINYKRLHHGLLRISASAGSGKTYTLAERYIMLMLFEQDEHGLLHYRQQGAYHSHILAITFTNKATEEMKKRIIDELYILATTPDDSKFKRDFDEMSQEHHCFAPGVLDVEQLQHEARKALATVLYDYGVFNVSTIDSFFQSILRNFARELDRDYNYEVQIDEDLALQTAIHNFLLSLGADARRHQGRYHLTDVERWVQDYIRQQVSNGKDWNFFKDDGGLLNFAKLMNKEFFRQQMPKLNEYLTCEVDGKRLPDLKQINAFKKCIIELADNYEIRYKAYAPFMQQLLDKYQVDRSCLWSNRLVQKLMQPDNQLARGEKYPKGLGELTEEKLIKNNFTKKYVPEQGFIDEVMAWRQQVIATWHTWQLLVKLPADLGLLALLNSIDENLKQYSRDTNQLLLTDTNDLISRVLGCGVPFIYERVGTWLNHFMIDEFQDTSLKQYENFMPLIEDAMARSDENLCMLIGDAKQSIYRFRNAEPSLFRDRVIRDACSHQFEYYEDPLETNYRSCPAVVNFNNWLFGQLLNDPSLCNSQLLKDTYIRDGFTQKLGKTEPEGMVKVQFVAKDKDGDGTKAADLVLAKLPEYLNQLHERFAWGRIGILVNRRKEGDAVVLRIMQHNKTVAPNEQIAISSDESMLIANSPSVKRIVSLLRFIDLTQFRVPEDQADEYADDPTRQDHLINRARLNDQYFYHVLGRFMQQMAADENLDPGQVLEQCFEQTQAIKNMTDDQQMNEYAAQVDKLLPERSTEPMTLTNIVEHIIAQFMQETESVPQETAHLLAFQDCVCDFAGQRSGGTVREFLRYWDTKCDKLTVPASASDDAISVMTIHKSKGLEFDCVVVPFANWELHGEDGQRSQQFWVSKDVLKQQQGMDILLQHEAMTEDLVPPLLPLSQTEVRKLAEADVCLKQYVDKFDNDVLVDNMDKTYVAFTRPKKEMHIFAFADREIGQMMQSIFTSDDRNVCLTQVDANTFQWGEPCQPVAGTGGSDQEGVKMVPMPPYRVASGVGRLHVRLPEDLTDKQNTGTRLHNLMSRIAYRRDVERAWGFCLNRGIIRADDNEWPLERIRGIIDNMFADPRTTAWFADDNKVYNERNLSSGARTTGATKRPDRVVLRPDGTWIVIDYKFGEKNVEGHSRQVKAYMHRLARMGKKHILGYIWYVGHDDIVQVV